MNLHQMTPLKGVKGYFNPKYKFCHHFLTPKNVKDEAIAQKKEKLTENVTAVGGSILVPLFRACF